jgi:hypothetical protein
MALFLLLPLCRVLSPLFQGGLHVGTYSTGLYRFFN